MTEKYSRAIAEQETEDSAPLREERVRKVIVVSQALLHGIISTTDVLVSCLQRLPPTGFAFGVDSVFQLIDPPNLGRPSRQERAKEELARAARAHNGAVAALEATLAAEKSHCQDLRVRLERQTREHQVALAEADQRLLHTQEELDKVRTNEGEGGVEECSGCS